METQRNEIEERQHQDEDDGEKGIKAATPGWIEAKGKKYGAEPWVEDWKKEQYALLATYEKADKGATAATGWVAESGLLGFSESGIKSRDILDDEIVIEFGRFWTDDTSICFSGDRQDGDGYEPLGPQALKDALDTLNWTRNGIKSLPRHSEPVVGVKGRGKRMRIGIGVGANAPTVSAVVVPGAGGEFCRMRWRLRNVVTGAIITDVDLGYEDERQELLILMERSHKTIMKMREAERAKAGPWRTVV